MALDKGVKAALDRKYRAIIRLEVALHALLTNTPADDSITSLIDRLEEEADAVERVLDGSKDPSIDELTPADATAIQNAVTAANNAVAQSAAAQTLLNAAAVLVGTIQQS